jgi:hypothetical protein
MSDEEFKYLIDINKIKNNKLYNKFIKTMDKNAIQPKQDTPPRPA